MTTLRPVVTPVPSSGPRARIIDSLIDASDGFPIGRKRLVGPDINYGRELLVTLAKVRGGWIGWEATNLRGIAESLAFVALAQAGRRIAGDVETGALTNRAIDEAIAKQRVHARTASLARSLGFRHAVRDALLELRMAGVPASDLVARTAAGTPARELAEILPIYERLLDETMLVDSAGVFRAAIDSFDAEASYVLDGETFLAPALIAHGLPGVLLERLIARGARVLAGDTASDLTVPPGAALHLAPGDDPTRRTHSLLAWAGSATLPEPDDPSLDRSAIAFDIFAAATPSDELREVLRRALEEGLHWEEVEIVTPDPDTYGIALDVLCQRVGLGATMLHGIPFARTRLGRALNRWLAWLNDGLPADTLRQALEAGELGAPGDAIAPTALGRELRRHKIGWGRGRWDAAVSRLARGVTTTSYEDEPDSEYLARKASRDHSAAALRTLLTRLLAATPAVPERGDDRPVRSSAAALARATLEWLDLVPLHGPPEERTAERLRSRLEQVAAIDEPDSPFSAAMAGLRDAISDLRAWPMLTAERKPWSAAGGMVHLTDIAHAGTTGRCRTFVVGLDAGRTNGSGRQDPLLPDGVRRAVAPGRLTTSTDRRDATTWMMATALASLRGRVTLSYASSSSLDGSEAGPSPLLLQAWRLSLGDASTSYDALRTAMRPPASSVPMRPTLGASSGAGNRPPQAACIDARDVWLAAIADGPLLLDGNALIRESFPLLRSGLEAFAAAAGAEASAYHGLVPRAAGSLDPTLRPDRQISPSSLEQLAKCPMAWFYRYGLDVRGPSDPAYDQDAWRDDRARGTLLYEVYERFARQYVGRQHGILHAGARAAVVAIADEVIARWRDQVPPPAETVFDTECAELRVAALSFLEMERERLAVGDGAVWWKLEHGFGGRETAGTFQLPDGRSIAIYGRVDRIDQMADGSLLVIDYKTGSATRFRRNPKRGPFEGGRQLQPAVYAAAVSALLGVPVGRFEYRFPTDRGDGEIIGYSAAELAAAPALIAELLEHVRLGHFVATDDSADCKFCDYGAVCRSTEDRFHNVSTPRAAWAKNNGGSVPVYGIMRSLRTRSAPDAVDA